MDTYLVTGHLNYGYGWVGAGPCPICGDEDGDGQPLPCGDHSDCVHLSETAEAKSAEEVLEFVGGAFVLRKAADGWDAEPYNWSSLDVTNLSEIARDRAALTAWNLGLPIPGGPPVEFHAGWSKVLQYSKSGGAPEGETKP